MDITITPGILRGTVRAIPSKSVAHRLLICAAFSDAPTFLECPQTNDDIEATVSCLNCLGASIIRTETGYQVTPAGTIPEKAELPCRESGSTLRFLLPVVGALGVEGTFRLSGRLPSRPLSPLWEEMTRMGCTLSRPTQNTVLCQGKLHAGHFELDTGVSSQFISGLLFAMALLPGSSDLCLLGKVESAPYITMTRQALAQFGIPTDDFRVAPEHRFTSPGDVTVEGDWSNAAFFLAAKAMGNDVEVANLSPDSAQGDRAIVDCLSRMESFAEIDAADIPDLVPILAVAASSLHGGRFHNIARLRLKESDRVTSVFNLINGLGGRAESDETTLTVYPGRFSGGIVDAVNDHRIAMAAAIAATAASAPVTILGAECVRKSYPDFWDVYQALGGKL